MSEKNDGGPAFPHCSRCGENANQRVAPLLAAIDLRDYFAAKAMQGMVSAEFAGNVTTDYWAEEAYKVADAMLKARDK